MSITRSGSFEFGSLAQGLFAEEVGREQCCGDSRCAGLLETLTAREVLACGMSILEADLLSSGWWLAAARGGGF